MCHRGAPISTLNIDKKIFLKRQIGFIRGRKWFHLSEAVGVPSCGMDLALRVERIFLSEAVGADSFGTDLAQREQRMFFSEAAGANSLGIDLTPRDFRKFVKPKRLLFSEIAGVQFLRD